MNVGLFIDGPNMLRKDVHVNMDKVIDTCKQFGKLTVKKMYLNKHATEGLIHAMRKEGLDIIITKYDVDIPLALDASEAVFSDRIDVLVLLTRDTDYLPLLIEAKKRGILTVVIGIGMGFSVALKHTADRVIFIK
ncbi:NYN domain-containing protein [Candidatus Micrarchaeota archaeon]|nr:NYN domain-containing protein [Candidatus Micrarchaeota archaeon]